MANIRRNREKWRNRHANLFRGMRGDLKTCKICRASLSFIVPIVPRQPRHLKDCTCQGNRDVSSNPVFFMQAEMPRRALPCKKAGSLQHPGEEGSGLAAVDGGERWQEAHQLQEGRHHRPGVSSPPASSHASMTPCSLVRAGKKRRQLWRLLGRSLCKPQQSCDMGYVSSSAAEAGGYPTAAVAFHPVASGLRAGMHCVGIIPAVPRGTTFCRPTPQRKRLRRISA